MSHALNKKSSTSVEEEGKVQDSGETFEKRKADVVSSVRSFVQATFDDLHVASREESNALLKGLDYIRSEEDLAGWETYVQGTMQDQLASARSLYGELMNPLLKALSDKAISERIVKKLHDEFKSESADYKSKEAYVQAVLPKRLKEWYAVKDKRDILIAEPNINVLKKFGIENFSKLFDPASFADMKWEARKKLVLEVSAKLHAVDNGTEKLLPTVEAELYNYAEEGILHESKVAVWMDRIFSYQETSEKIELFLKKIVRPYAKRWRAIKRTFDGLNATMSNNVPRGFYPATADEFLLKNYKQRVTYCAYMKQRMKAAVFEDTRLQQAITAVQLKADMNDWTAAERLLATARLQFGDHEDLHTLNAYIQTHKDSSKESIHASSKEPEELYSDVKHWLSLVPVEVYGLVSEACKNINELNCLSDIFGGRIWLREVSNWDDAREREEIYKATHGQKQEIGMLIDPDAMGDETTMSIVRSHASEENSASSDAVWRLWTSIVPSNLSYKAQYNLVKNVMPGLKNAIRNLNKAGFGYGMSSMRRINV